jgi:predicted ATPase
VKASRCPREYHEADESLIFHSGFLVLLPFFQVLNTEWRGRL